ncbi:MAG: anaerobic sulfatase-maturation protein [Tannerellaceae bacterium]|jgi:uncharacterized protein|nr:anaerobic sulfatase-maturation protein [Tannerellaceae bacterium]
MNKQAVSPFAKPVYVMLKPAGSVCNLACEYCYYLEKGKLYTHVKSHSMPEELLERFIQEYLSSQTMQQVLFTWHGGETLMRPVSFYRKALALQRKYAQGREIDNCIQTNGTLLNDEWCRFFKENNFLVGVSIDGPQEFHDEYRRNRQGLPSFVKVMKGIRLLKKYGVAYNAMAVINDYNVDYPLDFYNFFKELACQYIQFAPAVERVDAHAGDRVLTTPEQQHAAIKPAPFSVDAEKWGDFLCAIFDKWLEKDVGTYYIQLFDATLANWAGLPPGVCIFAQTCGHAGVMEFNGDVYACDHYVFPEYKLGNIYAKTITEMMYSPEQMKFGADKFDKLPAQCKACDYLFACNGECPKNRFLYTANGEYGLNYLCKGYKKFFNHAAPYMDYMKNELLAGRPPANVMRVAGQFST